MHRKQSKVKTNGEVVENGADKKRYKFKISERKNIQKMRIRGLRT